MPVEVVAAKQSGHGRISIPQAPPPPGGVIQLTARVRRMVTGSGSILVSSGFPLRPGQLTLANLNYVRVFVVGAEKSLYVEALDGRHSDGSLKSILIQFTHTLTYGSPLTAEVRLGELRDTATDVAKVAINAQPSMPPVHPSYLVAPNSGTHQVYLYGYPGAVLVSDDPTHLINCGLALPMLTRSTEFALGGEFADRITDFERGVGVRMTQLQASSFTVPAGATMGDWAYDRFYYDRGVAGFSHYLATADEDVYFRWACIETYAWRELYAKPTGPNGSTVDGYRYNYQHAFPDGPLMHYWLTGDPESRTAVIQQATWNLNSFAYDTCQGSRHNPNQDPREMAYALKNWIALYRLGLTTAVSRQDGGTVDVLARIRTGLNRVLGVGTYNNTGFFASHSFGESPMYQTSGAKQGIWQQGLDALCPDTVTMFMQGGAAPDALVKYQYFVEPDSRIPNAVKGALDWCWTNAWRRNLSLTEYSFNYLSDNACPSEGGATPSPILNLLYIGPMAYVKYTTGNAAYTSRCADIAFGADTDGAADDGAVQKQFNQQQVFSYYHAFFLN